MRAKTSWRAKCPDAAVLERRRKERQAAEGEVVLFLEDPKPVWIRGRLVDVNATGFRAGHQYTTLRAGQLVTFRHAFAQGLARVVWNRVIGNLVESGFQILRTTNP